ncbi:N-formylglutamate amidohydrolase [Peteryoungia ipomoeae]|uniref:N-formylglutamate amidohydrolase n=1 Tax=Peteryoungia ipomoeae TaxID=1210932 RepID=A0A4S8P622_9HYPH|nr:N-formylglutamate amidohydrolase [Peteryoungia ipomoeae]THV24801.1 N-formylglutamate amidohydrolase [Peteryoungia ipomoeae]
MLVRSGILAAADGDAVSVHNETGAGDVVLICEHASNRFPVSALDLGLSQEVRDSHAAWDPGALALAMLLSSRLDAVLIQANFSRLLYDCNRPPESPAAMPAKSEVYEISANVGLSAAERYARMAAFYVPFHDRISETFSARVGQGRRTVVITIHTFTPVYFGQPRSVEIGILHDADSRLADAMLALAPGEPYRIERNAPYGPDDGVTHSLQLHALPGGHLNVMIEVRNDLVRDEPGLAAAAECLERMVSNALATLSEASAGEA